MTPQGCELPAKLQEEEPLTSRLDKPIPAETQDHCLLLPFRQGSGHPGLPGRRAGSSGQASQLQALPRPGHAFKRRFSIPSGNQLHFSQTPKSPSQLSSFQKTVSSTTLHDVTRSSQPPSPDLG